MPYYITILKGLILRDIRGRFSGTFGGALWSMIGPLATISVYVFVFSQVFRVQVSQDETGTSSYIIYFLTGVFLWIIFSEGLSKAAFSLVDNASLITKTFFPPQVLPVSSVISAFFMPGAGLSFIFFVVLYYGYLSWTWVFIPVVLILLFMFTLGVALFLSALSVFLRDIREILPVLLMIWFFSTPILYPLSLVPDYLAFFIQFNPLAHFVQFFRGIILPGEIMLQSLAFCSLFSVLSMLAGVFFFRKCRPALADVL